MKKLTDEMVAKALFGVCPVGCGGINKGASMHPYHLDEIPKFTESLDAICAEIERRGLWWKATAGNGRVCAAAWVNEMQKLDSDNNYRQESTAPLALCKALLAFIRQEGE